MTNFADACRASARRCAEIAANTGTIEDRCEFTSFAATWQKLALEIECNERLITLIDELGSRASPSPSSDRKAGQVSEQDASANSLRRLATAILSVSNHYMAAISGDQEEPGAA